MGSTEFIFPIEGVFNLTDAGLPNAKIQVVNSGDFKVFPKTIKIHNTVWHFFPN